MPLSTALQFRTRKQLSFCPHLTSFTNLFFYQLAQNYKYHYSLKDSSVNNRSLTCNNQAKTLSAIIEKPDERLVWTCNHQIRYL